MHHGNDVAPARSHGVQWLVAKQRRLYAGCSRRRHATLILILALAAPAQSLAQESVASSAPAPVVFRASWTQFLGWAVEGQGSDVSRLGAS